MKAIKFYDLISFDIFDTLLQRKLRAPVDIFECIRLKAFESRYALLNHDILDNFTYYRMQAEALSRRAIVERSNGEGEVTLDEIYEEFDRISNCRPELSTYLKEQECLLEDAFLSALPEGLAMYKEAKAAGVKIAFISDMYLPSTWLLAKLEREGFVDASENSIFVSGERRRSKHSGGLYAIVSTELRISDHSKWLHIGDNEVADIKRARDRGIATLHAVWSNVDNRHKPNPGSPATHVVSSLLAYLETKQAQGKVPADSLERLGYTIWGPLLFGFILWLCERTRMANLEKLLFIARDGWFLEKLFNRVQNKAKLPNVVTEYFHMSRGTVYPTGIREWNVARNEYLTGSRARRSARRVLATLKISAEGQQAALSRKHVFDIDLPFHPQDQWILKDALDTLFQPVLAQNQQNRAIFEPYFSKALSPEGSLGFVDIGWAGNIQRSFTHSITELSAKTRIHGLYFATLGSVRENLEQGFKISGWFCNAHNNAYRQDLLLNGGVELMEFALTANHGTATDIAIDDKDNFKPIIEPLTGAKLRYMEKAMAVQAGVWKYFDDYEFLLDHYSPRSLVTEEWGAPFERLVDRPTGEEADLLGGLEHDDAPGKGDGGIRIARKLPFYHRWFKSRKFLKERTLAYWKRGFDMRNR